MYVHLCCVHALYSVPYTPLSLSLSVCVCVCVCVVKVFSGVVTERTASSSLDKEAARPTQVSGV